MTDAGPVRLLLVEDRDEDLQRARAQLSATQSPPFALTEVASVGAALERLAAERFDAILLDLAVRDGAGIAAIDQVRTLAADVPIIVLTGLDNHHMGLDALRHGAQDYLVKDDLSRDVLARAVQNARARQELQRALAERTAELEAANRVKDLFIDIMRHDLLDQVNVILGAADLLLQQPTSAENRDLLQTVVRRAERLTEIIRAASLYAKLEHPAALERERLDLHAIIVAAVADVRPRLQEKNQRITVRSEPGTFALVNPIIHHAITNLLANAVRYSPPGRRIEVRLTATGHGYRVAVKDWGEGVPAALRPHLFSRLQRPAGTAARGSGLGLAIVKRIVDLHGGTVRHEDNPEGGSIFTIELPAPDDAVPGGRNAASSARHGGT